MILMRLATAAITGVGIVSGLGVDYPEVVTALHPERPQPLRGRRRTPVELAERHRAPMVDDRRALAVANRRCGVEGGEAAGVLDLLVELLGRGEGVFLVSVSAPVGDQDNDVPAVEALGEISP